MAEENLSERSQTLFFQIMPMMMCRIQGEEISDRNFLRNADLMTTNEILNLIRIPMIVNGGVRRVHLESFITSSKGPILSPKSSL